MSKHLNSRSLSVQLLFRVVLSLILAVGVFLGCFALGSLVLDRTVYSDKYMVRKEERQFISLQDYVEENGITTDNIGRLNAWCKRGNRLNLTIYRDTELIFAFPSDIEGSALESEDLTKENILLLSDETAVQAFLYYYAGETYYYSVVVISGVIAFFAFAFCFTSVVHRKIRYIEQLKSDLDILAGGELTHPIHIEGRDELGELAYGLDQMRLSILNHQAVENEIRSSNSKLVTAMSHDLRTPLTSLLAYLELLDRGKYEGPEQMQLYIKRSLGQAMRIKSMADQLFEYFLVYATQQERAELTPMEADPLFQQIWGEYAFSLESQGYLVECAFAPLQGRIAVNAEMLRRVFDNLYSNLLKYADRSKAITIRFEMQPSQVALEISNGITPERDRQESTYLGLNTCSKIMQLHNGTFDASELNGVFRTVLTLPTYQEESRPS